MSNTLRVSILLAASLYIALAVTTCKKRDGNPKHKGLMYLAQVQYKCENVKVVREKNQDWSVLDVCGTQRFYEWGRWCEECSFSWRERKIKSK